MKKIFVAKHGTSTHLAITAFNWLLVGAAAAALFYFAFTSFSFNLHWQSVWKYRTLFLIGFVNTIVISFFSLLTSIIFGLLISAARDSRIIPLKILAKLYVEIIRGTPLLVQILIFYYVIANAAGLSNRYVSGVIILSFFSGAYVAELFRAGVQSVNSTQLETSLAVGFTRGQTFRYVVFPQVIRQVLPSLAGQMVSLVKDSSLLSVISIREFTMASREITAATYSTLETYIPLAAGYLLLTFPISAFSKWLEKRFAYDA